MIKWADSEDDIVNYFNKSQAAQEASQGDHRNITKVMAGLLFPSMEDYTIRLALSTDQNEARTDKLFPASLIRFGSEPRSCHRNSRNTGSTRRVYNSWGTESYDCQEEQYAFFEILQTIVDQALMWNKASAGYDIFEMIPKDSLLPTNKEEKCSPKLVTWLNT